MTLRRIGQSSLLLNGNRVVQHMDQSSTDVEESYRLNGGDTTLLGFPGLPLYEDKGTSCRYLRRMNCLIAWSV